MRAPRRAGGGRRAAAPAGATRVLAADGSLITEFHDRNRTRAYLGGPAHTGGGTCTFAVGSLQLPCAS